MASLQLENGYLRIANELLDALGKINLNGTKFKVVLLSYDFRFPCILLTVSTKTGIQIKSGESGGGCC